MSESAVPTLDASADSRESSNGRVPSRPQSQVTVTVDDATVAATYANFFRITSTPEEVILDLGLNAQAFTPADATVKVCQRIVLNYYTAKRLLGALSAAVQRHEKSFGVLETDVMKRLHPHQH